MKKNDMIELVIEDMGVDGSGIGKSGGMTFFVKDALIGDTARVKIIKLKKTYGYARLMELLEPSPYRVQPRCPLHRQCGGCQIQALSYEKQLEYKENKIRGSLIHIGGFVPEEIPMRPVIGMKDIYRYRNKAQFPVGRDKDGNLAAGFYASRTHCMIPAEDCYLGTEQNREIIKRVLAWMRQYHIEPYDERDGSGLVRHVLIRSGFRTGQLMVCLAVNGTSVPRSKPLIKKLTEVDGMTSISFSVNKQRGNVIMGETFQTLWGADYIEDMIKDLRFQISPLSFYQVNPVQTEVLYDKVLEYAGLAGGEIVWDLYCGIGTISLFLARKAKQVYGIEIIPQAAADAGRNAELNHITNAEFFTGKAEECMPQLCAQQPDRYPQVVVVDPPRKGCAESLLDAIIHVQPERVVYVSCDSATLARDLKYLCGHGYVMKEVQGVDLFGHTVHVETVCLLSKLHSDQHIEVELKMDELDLTAAESKATYEEIKDYVLEHTGLKVSSLYIAQIKEKCGIIERANYNLPKSENSRQPKCPPEKEKAIRDALEYFRMI